MHFRTRVIELEVVPGAGIYWRLGRWDGWVGK